MAGAVTFTLPRTMGWITSQAEPGTDTKTYVDERFEAVSELVESSRLEFADAIERMNASLSPIVVNDLALDEIVVPDLGGDIPTFTGTFDATFTATLDDFNVEYVEPGGKPSSAAVEWEDAVISLEPELIGKLAEWLTLGETAIPSAIISQIYGAAETQLDEQRVEAILVAESTAAARGFEAPSGVMDNKLLQIEREYGKAAAELSANLASKNMELTQANFHKAVEVANTYIMAAQDYLVKKNTAKIQWYSAAVDAWVKQVEAAIKIIDAKVAAFNGKVEAYKAKAMVYSTEADVFTSTIQAYAALVEGLKAKIGAVAETVKMKVQVFQVESAAMIEEEKLKVSAQIQNQTLAQRIAEAQSQMHAQMVASGLSAMHVQASVSASHGTGQQVGYSYSYGEQMSEQHSESVSVNAEV